MQLAVIVLLVVFMMTINVRHDDVRQNAIMISLYDMMFFFLSHQGFIKLSINQDFKISRFLFESRPSQGM